jgi:hypothetical protein
VINGEISIPAEIVDLGSFCRWVTSDQNPRRERISYLRGLIWVESYPEKVFAYNPLKYEATQVLDSLAKGLGTGRYSSDGIRVRNKAADLCTEPDGIFVAYQSVRDKRVVRVESLNHLILEGSPEMVLEVFGGAGLHKDKKRLSDLYWRAGIVEYWVLDVRGDRPLFQMLKRDEKGYIATRKTGGGWLRSGVFGKSFRLSRRVDPLGELQFVLECRD